MMTLHYDGTSSHSASVLIALSEKGLDFKGHEINLAQFEQHDPAFLALNPTGQVPVLEDGERRLTETFFILLYLDEQYPTPPLGGETATNRYDVQKWGKYVETHIAPNLAIVGWAERSNTQDQATQRNFDTLPQARKLLWQQAERGFEISAVTAARTAIEKGLNRLGEALSSSEWLAGKSYSLADIIVFPHIARARALGFPIADPVNTWLTAIQMRPQAEKAFGEGSSHQYASTMGPEIGRWG